MSTQRRDLLVATVLFAGLTLLFTFPLWIQPDAALHELGDTSLNAWIIAWDAHALVTDPLHLFDANIFFPHKRTLAFSENLLGTAIPVAPLNWLGHPILAYNVAFMLSFVLTGVATTLWVRHLTGSLAAGLVAGVIWTFGPPRMGHLAQIQMLSGQWVPLAFLGLTRYLETGRTRFALQCAGWVGLQFITSIYYGLFLVPCLATYGILLLLHLPRRQGALTPLKVVRDGIVMALIVAALALPVTLPYREASAAEDFVRGIDEVRLYSARPSGFLSPAWLHSSPHMRWLFERYHRVESELFIGVVPWALALFALWLMQQAWRGRWWASVGAYRRRSRVVEKACSVEGPSEGLFPRPGFLTWLARGVYRSAFGIAVLAAVLHIATLVTVAWWAAAPVSRWLVDISQFLHPAAWLACAAGVTVAFWPSRRLVFGTRSRTDLRPIYLVVIGYLTLLTYLLALGPVVQGWDTALGRGPYWLLYEFVQPFKGIRSPARIGILWSLFAAVLAAFSVTVILEKVSWWVGSRAFRFGKRSRDLRRRFLGLPPAATVLSAILVIIVINYRSWPLPTQPVDPHEDAVDSWLAEQDGTFAVLHLPMRPGEVPARETRYMLGSTKHWKPQVNGYSGFFPRDYGLLVAREPFSDDFYRQLRYDFPIRYLLVHGSLYGPDFERELVPRLMSDTKNLLFETRVDDTFVFRVRQKWDRGVVVRRTYPLTSLENSERISFEARSTSVLKNRRPYLRVSLGDMELGYFRLSGDWTELVVPVPEKIIATHDEMAAIRFVSGYELVQPQSRHEIGTTGTQLWADLLLQIREAGHMLLVNEKLYSRDGEPGFHVYLIGSEVAVYDQLKTTVRSEFFRADDVGAVGFERFIEGLPAGQIVACAIRFDAPSAFSAATLAALESIGSALAFEEEITKVAMVGIKGSSTGSIVEGSDDAVIRIRIGNRVERTEVAFRRIRLR